MQQSLERCGHDTVTAHKILTDIAFTQFNMHDKNATAVKAQQRDEDYKPQTSDFS